MRFSSEVFVEGQSQKYLLGEKKNKQEKKGTKLSKYILLDCSGTDRLLGNKCQPFKVCMTNYLLVVSVFRKERECYLLV